MLSTLSKFGVDVGAGVAVGLGVPVGGTKVAVGTSVAFTPQAESASPADVAPASFRKSRRDSFLLIFSYVLQGTAQRIGSPAAVIARLQTYNSTKLCKARLHTRAEGGQCASDVGRFLALCCCCHYVRSNFTFQLIS